jgi:hypothetical protein
LNAKKSPTRRTKTSAKAAKAKGRVRPGAAVEDSSALSPPAAGAAAPAPAPAPRQETPFERFVLDFIRARGGSAEQLENGDFEATFDPELAKRLRRQGARLVFDPERAILPRRGLFAAPGSRLGLALLDLGRGHGHVSRTHVAELPDVDATALAKEGFPVHGARPAGYTVGEKRWVLELVFHATLTYHGGMAEQELRTIVADPRGPRFDFLETEDRRGWKLEDGIPAEGRVFWGDHPIDGGLPREEAWRLWADLVEWVNRVLEPRLERWRRRCEDSRDRDLARVNAYYDTRLNEERERRRRRGQSEDQEDQATEADLKLEWGRRVKSVRARWEPQVEMRLWGIEEIARPRVPVTWKVKTPQGERILEGEIDLAQGAPAKLPCPVCGRLVGEFWWEGGFVCRRCRGKGGRLAVVSGAAGGVPESSNGKSPREASAKPRATAKRASPKRSGRR